MAHEVETLMFTGKVPWHGIGVELADNPTIGEAINAAGLDWTVVLKKLQTLDGIPVPGYATVRESDNTVLGVVGPDYSVLQNIEAFDWFEPFMESGMVRLEVAGSLRRGRRIFVLARIISDPLVIVKKAGDTVDRFILLSNGHDGMMSARGGFTGIRVVCANTMSMAHNSKASKLIRVRHKGDINANLEKVREIMNVANQEFEATAEQYRFLASREINERDLEKFVKRIFAPKKKEDEAKAPQGVMADPKVLQAVGKTLMNDLLGSSEPEDEDRKGERIVEQIKPLFEGGRGNDLPGVKGTYWAAYNAVTEYLSYERGKDQDTRLDNLWFGQGANLNKKALEEALEMASKAA